MQHDGGSPNVEIHPDPDAAAAAVADRFARTLGDLPHPVLGLATGSTPLPVYRQLIERYRAGQLRFDHATFFNLDEYQGLAPEHPQSYHAYMRHHFFDAVGVSVDRTHLPDGTSEPDIAATNFEQSIQRSGGIDLQLLGIGHNGHIGFNEPGSPRDSRTRAVELAAGTIDANARFFDDPADVPRRAITMGIATILSARHIVLLATGKSKAAAVAAALRGPVGPDNPASFLQTHDRVDFVLDRAAAAELV